MLNFSYLFYFIFVAMAHMMPKIAGRLLTMFWKTNGPEPMVFTIYLGLQCLWEMQP